MSDSSGADPYYAMRELRDEIHRLQQELDDTTKEKLQAAEYGLVVLEEKQQLQQQCEELESLYETAKHELDCAKEVCDSLKICLFYSIKLEICRR